MIADFECDNDISSLSPSKMKEAPSNQEVRGATFWPDVIHHRYGSQAFLTCHAEAIPRLSSCHVSLHSPSAAYTTPTTPQHIQFKLSILSTLSALYGSYPYESFPFMLVKCLQERGPFSHCYIQRAIPSHFFVMYLSCDLARTQIWKLPLAYSYARQLPSLLREGYLV